MVFLVKMKQRSARCVFRQCAARCSRENADGTPSEVVKERTYDLKSDKQGRMIQVSVPASIPVRDFAYNAEVKLVNPMFGAIAHVTFGNSAEVDWYIKADDLVLKTPAQNSQPHKDVPADKKS